ncbi:phage tail protein [Priestia megaterium]
MTNPSTLLAKVEKSIIDEPEVSFCLEYIEMQKQGFNVPLDEGDTVPTIYEPLDVDLDLRVIEITDYPESNKSPVLTLSNKKDNVVDVTFNYAKQLLDQIWNENSKR